MEWNVECRDHLVRRPRGRAFVFGFGWSKIFLVSKSGNATYFGASSVQLSPAWSPSVYPFGPQRLANLFEDRGLRS